MADILTLLDEYLFNTNVYVLFSSQASNLTAQYAIIFGQGIVSLQNSVVFEIKWKLCILRRWKEVMFWRYRICGKLTKDKPEENEDEMKYDAFLCYRLVIHNDY